jgi:hypothetical protein
VTEPAPRRHRRRERRRTRPAGTAMPPAGADGAPGQAASPGHAAGGGTGRADRSGGAGAAGEGGEPARARPRPARRPDVERGLRGIVGPGPSQVGVLGAMRARDAAKPTAEDLAAAERDLLIVRRHYVPPDPDPR